MICWRCSVIFSFAVLLLSTRLRRSQTLINNNDEIITRNERAALPPPEESSTIDASQVSEEEFQRAQVSEDALQFEATQDAFIEASELVKSQDGFEKELIAQNIVLNNEDTPEFHHSQFLKTKPEALALSKLALTKEFATLALLENSELAESDSLLIGIPSTIISPFVPCPPPEVCNSNDDKYRRYDGSCNNKVKTLLGKTFTPFIRLISPPNYHDNVKKPRVSVATTGSPEVPLPSARLISSKISSDIDKPSSQYTLSVMQWGQFIDHDLTHTPIAVLSGPYGISGIQCCNPDGSHLPASSLDPECFPIDIPIDDPFYMEFNRTCMNFVRSLSALSIDCTLGFRNQINQISHYLDGSNVYGSSDDENSRLRTFQDGLLKDQPESLLPPDDSTSNLHDYLAGDLRVNEQPQLSIIHTLWLRQHNRVAMKLKTLNSLWDDEKLFQEARRIIVGQIQHIVYNEWLPIILGTDTMTKSQLVPKTTGYLNSYSKNRDATIINEFSTVAFRFGHTLVQGDIALYSKCCGAGSISLSENFDNPSLISGVTTFEQLLRGLFKQPIQNFDQCVVDDLSNKLFKTNMPFGLDLVALNIQRGRDHGVGTYSQIRDACPIMGPAVDFDSLNDYIDPATIEKLREVYNDQIEDVDAFIAGIAEQPYLGGILGPLFNCIVSKQFFNLKYADRFYYENGNMTTSFTLDQLNEIRKTTWARIICDNTFDLGEIQPRAFRLQDTTNAKVSCNDYTKIPDVNLNFW